MIDADVLDALNSATASSIHGATTKVVPADADEFGFTDSTASYSLRKFTWLQFKAVLKLYFDSIYATLVSPVFQTSIDMAIGGVYKYAGQTLIKVNDGLRCYFFGTGSNHSTLTGADNVGVGKSVLQSLIGGNNNVGIGTAALAANQTGNFNMAVGANALSANVAGNANAGIGFNALAANTGSDNLAFGAFAMWRNTTGANNCAFGSSALVLNTTGIANTGFGREALQKNTKGNYNVAIGHRSFYNFDNTGGSDTKNSGFGALSGFSVTTGTESTLAGFQAGYDITTGAKNTFVGSNTGRGIATGGSNTILGANVTGLSSSTANNIILADGNGNIRLRWNGQYWNLAPGTPPTSASDPGTAGDMSWDANYIYFCVATDTWKRVAISTW